ncbi:hypothetical protein GCM10007862_08160 [Dyella lipolytica]|uniref:Uncharacterized protein n=1 Tax=Dyella lipolytica TaxID=1867835 RepID=A0ABW8IY50_9GAMM|nr:hypothetical protein [Dyella lipolytica]GLQ45765.1 hypothetical protein GCM10007862_08160 [Dyella lipolytica]
MEKVYTVWDYHDGPRTGIADYRGRPHYYSCQFDQSADEYGNTYALFPIDANTFALALEQWAIWQAWEIAFHSGQVSTESHPGNDGRDSRCDELKRLLQHRLEALPASNIHVYARFHSSPQGATEIGPMEKFFVGWSDAD